MDLVDLIKATVLCGIIAFLCYSFPVVGQAMVIGFLGLIWLGYLRTTVVRRLRR